MGFVAKLRRNFSLVLFRELPADLARHVEHIRRRVRQELAFRGRGFVAQSIEVDDLVLGITQQGNHEDPTGVLGDTRDNILDLVHRVRTNTDNQRVLTVVGRQKRLQLDQLLGAVRSPIAAVKHQHDVPAAQTAQLEVSALGRGQLEIRRHGSSDDAVQVGG